MLTKIDAGDVRSFTGPMRVLGTRVYRGPHLYSQTPMIQIELELGALELLPTDQLPGFAEALVARVPGLMTHGCSYGEDGGFIRRMTEGTWLGHVAEHVAIELQKMAGTHVSRGKTRSVKGRPGAYFVMFAYKDEALGRAAGRLALELVDSLLPPPLRGIEGLGAVSEGLGEGFEAGLAGLRRLAAQRALGPTTASLVREAERRGIPAERMDDSSLILLGHGRKQRRVRASCSDLTSQVATEIAGDKDLTKLLLAQAGLPVPEGALVHSKEQAIAAAERLGHPVVTKPLDGNHGRGVNIGLASAEEVSWGFQQAVQESSTVIVEQNYSGADHRILVIGGEIIAVAERVPAHVVGDGRRSVVQLVEEVNRDPRRGEGHASVLTRIEIDTCVEHFLARSGLTPASVPEPGRTVFLRPTANLSTGGTAIDRTNVIHPENATIARRAAQIVGLDIAGIDFVCPDISRPVSETGGGIIEVNAGPGFRMHVEPSEGRPRNVARPVLDLLFPNRDDGRIPIFAVTGTNGKSTTARMLAHIMRQSGKRVGLTSTTGISLDDERIVSGDCAGPGSARIVLREPSVDVAVLECARGGILREGLAFAECDVGAVLNIAADHLGLKGVDTVEDLAEVKAVVVESVRRGGWSILNADDSLTAAMAEKAGGSICYFSMREEGQWPEFLKEHVRRGGRAVTSSRTAESWDVIIHEDGDAIPLMPVEAIPATFDGAAEFNVANALAAIAMAHCNGVPLAVVRDAMASFTTSFEHSPGRLNVFDGHGFRTVLDYAHNPEGLAALGKFVGRMRRRYQRSIGLVGMAGDRRDEDMREMGALAASIFDLIVFKEDDDLRGRRPGEVLNLLREGALGAGCSPSRIRTELSEKDAADLCLRLARPGDLVVLTADDIEAVWRQVLAFDRTQQRRGVPKRAPAHHLGAR